MDFDALVNEIVARVAQKLAEGSNKSTDDKPRLLILTQQHGDFCHAMLESTKLGEYYQTECALLQEYQCNPKDYEAAILFGLTNEALSKLASGMCDTPFTVLAQKLILTGKKIFVPIEEIELFQYEQTAPSAYYAMMNDKLDFLKSVGITICPKADLEATILNGEVTCAHTEPPVVKPEKTAPVPAVTVQEAQIDKRVISEKDIVAALAPGIAVLHVRENAILTDLARDYAASRRIKVLRIL